MDEQITKILTRLRQARQRSGLSQGQAAVMLGLSAASSFADIERGDNPLSLERFLTLCDLCGVSPVWALTGVNPDFDAYEARKALHCAGQDLERIMSVLESLEYREAE